MDVINANVTTGEIINATVDNTSENVNVTITTEAEVINATIESGARGEKGDKGDTGATGADSTVPGPQGNPGVVQSLVAGTGITIDNTNPANPIVTSSAISGVSSVNTKTGAAVLNPDDLDDTSTTHKFATATQITNSHAPGSDNQTLPVGGTPALTLGTANTAGASPDFLRRDDTILAFDATALTAEAIASASSVGTATTAARRDHRHPMPTALAMLSGVGGGYAACATAIGTAAKTVALTGYSLVVGGTVGVTFTNGNSAAAPTLNINSAGAKPIFANGAAVTTIPAGFNCLMMYDGANYNIIDGGLGVATPTTQAFGDTAVAGTALESAHVDHKHAMPAAPTRLISETTLGSNVTSFTISGLDIVTHGNVYELVISGTASAGADPTIALNGDTTANYLAMAYGLSTNSTVLGSYTTPTNAAFRVDTFFFVDYTIIRKPTGEIVIMGHWVDSTGFDRTVSFTSTTQRTNITSITFNTNGAVTMNSGTNIKIYKK